MVMTGWLGEQFVQAPAVLGQQDFPEGKLVNISKIDASAFVFEGLT